MPKYTLTKEWKLDDKVLETIIIQSEFEIEDAVLYQVAELLMGEFLSKEFLKIEKET